MPETSNTSFIPKRNPVKQKKANTPRPMFIGTLLIRIFFFAVLIASLGVLIYEKRVNAELDVEITNFDNAIASFSDENMQRIIDVDLRLKRIQERLRHTASVSSLFEAIELATVQTAQIESLTLDRVSDTEFEIESEMKTESFDSIIFQRGVYERDNKLEVTSIEELALNNPKENESSALQEENEDSVNFKAKLTISTDEIPHLINSNNSQIQEDLSESNPETIDNQTGL